MNILMTSETYLPRHGGAEIHVKNLIDRLSQSGHNIVLFTNEVSNGKETNDFVIRLGWSKRSLIKILKILWRKSENADIIHSHYSHRLAAMSAIIGRIRKVPVIVTLHGMGILDHPDTPFIYQIAHSTYRYLSLKLSTHVISTSEDLAKVAYKYISKRKVSIISNGFDEKVFHKDIKISEELLTKYKDNKIILTVRRLVPKNGIHYLVEAMPYIIKKIPNVKSVMIGDGAMREYIKKRINELGIKDHIDIVGELPNEKIPEYLKMSDVVVFPSTAESSSIACAEAMAVGCPVVASRVGGLVELIGSNEERGRLVKLVDWEESNYYAPLDIDSRRYERLATVVIDSIFSKSNKQVINALNYAEKNLNWGDVSKKTVEVYYKFIK